MPKRTTRKLNSREDVPSGYQKVVIPDEAIYYIVSNYLQEKTKTTGVSVLVGISTEAVQEVLRLFVDWAGMRGLVKDGVLTLDNTHLED